MIGLGVEREAHPESELRVVLEQRVAPRRAAAGRVDGPRRGRQVGPVDRRAARRVRHDHAIAEELADQPDVRRLAAAGARARELEERLEDLAALDRVARDQAAVEGFDGLEEVPADSLDVAMVRDRGHVDRLVARVGLALGRADVDADAAAGAIVRGDLDRESMVEQVPRAELLVEEVGRCLLEGGGGNTFIRIVACGQTIAHLPQSMQIDGSQIGIIWAIARFSYRAVPVGNVPSTGSALTGSRSPSPAIRRDVTRATKSGASSGTVRSSARRLVTRAQQVTWARRSRDRSMAAKLRATTASPRLAYVFSTKSLIRAMASSGAGCPRAGRSTVASPC